MSVIRDKIERLLDVMIHLLESSIERVADPDRIKYLQDSLRMADQRLVEFARENARLERELELTRPHDSSCKGVSPKVDLDRHLDAHWWKE